MLPAMSGRVDLHLRIRVSREKRPAFDAFLREAIPFYEAPGGIRVRLVQDEVDPTSLIEIIEYASIDAYQTARRRAANEKEMHQRLVRWRELLDGKPEVVAYLEQATIPRGPNAHRPHPTLRTVRLILRPFDEHDAPAMLPLIGDKRIAAMTANIPHPYESHHAQQWLSERCARWADGTGIVFAVCTPDAANPRGNLVGAVGLHGDPSQKRLEVGYWIGAPFWGKGYATEAARAVVDFGFRDLGMHRIHAYHFMGNDASGRVLEKAGLKREGVARGYVIKWGVPQDSVLYGLTRPDWEAQQPKPG